MSFVSDFKSFVVRGNAVDLAVGVIIGGGFTAVVTALTKDLLTPLVGIFGSTPDFSKAAFSIHGSTFMYGEFINAVITFIILAFVVFTFVVKPINWLMIHSKSQEPEPETTRECPECLSKIPVAAKRCAYCTAVVPVVTA